jgi:prolipoprotein diacylglyceryltransferase
MSIRVELLVIGGFTLRSYGVIVAIAILLAVGVAHYLAKGTAYLVFGILIALKNKKLPTGVLFLTYNILYSVGRFSLEFLRGDSPRYALNWTAGQWTSVTVILIALAFMAYLTKRTNVVKVHS